MSELVKNIPPLLQRGKMNDVACLVQRALDEGAPPLTILHEGLLAGMCNIGERFRKGTIFIPEVLIATRAVSAGIDVLREFLAHDADKSQGIVILGTIKDDLHDVGKNIVRMTMESKGLTVIDLGVDVAPARYIEAAIEHHADIIACSSLLTNTMCYLKDVVDCVEQHQLKGKVAVFIGGAPVNEEFCMRIGADVYTPDAFAAAEKALAFCIAMRQA